MNRRMLTPRFAFAGAAMLLVLLVASVGYALATEPTFSTENTCVEGGEACTGDESCSENSFATACVSSKCEIPCEAQDDQGNTIQSLEACALGERCVADGTRFTCQPHAFRVDLNLLDLCIKHYLDKTSPVFTANECSLERNLNLLLDQNNDKEFDLFDVDLCVLAFLEQQGCKEDPSTSDQVYQDGALEDAACCKTDSDCDPGTYCDENLNICQRDCGFVASREVSVEPFELECFRALTTCDYSRGRCATIDVTELTCEVDSDCLPGSYCLLGTCTPNCYRSLDCPDSGWYCAKNNQCRAVPPPEADEGFVFEPQNYTVRFARDELLLTDIQNFDSSQMAIMDLITNRQIIGNASVGFGYRMEIEYGLKEAAACLTAFVDCSTDAPEGETEMECWARQNDCLIDPSEEWIRPGAPFGRVNAAKIPEINLALEPSIADELTPGTYPATVRLIFDNGASDTITVTYTKKSPSGEYQGDLTVYRQDVENALNGDRTLTIAMRLKVFPEETRQWNQLMAAHDLDSDDDGLVDLTTGQLVHGHLHGEASMAFTRGGAGTGVEDEVHFVGLYSPDQGRLRIVGVIDILKNFELDADGGDDCSEAGAALCYKSIFDRDIRRRIEFLGPFVPASGKFHGIYRETISGLVPGDGLTIEGGFILTQQSSDDSHLEVDGPIGAKLATANFDFPAINISAAAVTGAGGPCSSFVTPGDLDVSTDSITNAVTNFANYISAAQHISVDGFMSVTACNDDGSCDGDLVCIYGTCQTGSVIFPNLVDFKDSIDLALNALAPGSTPTNEEPQNGLGETGSDPLDLEAGDGLVVQAHLNIYDFLEEWIVPCDPSDPSPPPGCIQEAELRCGLAVYQRAIIGNGASDPATISMDAVANAHPVGVEPDLFCYDTLPTDGCPSKAVDGSSNYKDLFALQEHNRFWRNLAQTLKFQGDRAQSDAFMVLFRNEVNPFAQGAAFSYKYDRLKEAIGSYDKVLDIFLDPTAATVLFKWPARSFKGMGKDWLAILHAVASDRMDALLELVDLERRVFTTATAADFRYAHHLMQQEYLIQVYLMVLQSQWQEELFAYKGEAAPIFQQAQAVVNRLNPVKNELGITGNQVFMENTDPELNNWMNYRALLAGPFGDGGEGGLLGMAQDEVGDAVEEMQASLSDLDGFEESLNEARISYADELADICGSSAPWVYNGATDTTAKTFAKADAHAVCQKYLETFDKVDDWITLRDCKLTQTSADTTDNVVSTSTATSETYVGWGTVSGALGVATPTCPAGAVFVCGQDCGDEGVNCDSEYEGECTDMIASFKTHTDNTEPTSAGASQGQNVGDLSSTPPRCGFEGFQEHMVSIPVQGVERPCVGGEMGAAFSEFERIQRSRRQVIGKVQTLIKTIQIKLKLIKAKWSSYFDKVLIREITISVEDAATIFEKYVLKLAHDIGMKVGDIPDCQFIAGFSIGTSCIGNGIGDGVEMTFSTLGYVAMGISAFLQYSMKRLRESLLILYEQKGAVREIGAEIQEIALGIEPLIDEYNMATQEAFNSYLGIEDLRNRAIRAGDRYAEDVYTVATHLVGRESGQILRGEALSRDASKSFQEILTVAYKMTMAFIHHYNVAPGDASNLVSQVKALTTLDDVHDFITELDQRTLDYCGLEGIDCDAQNNPEVLRFSLRDRLFPALTDVVDARTGKVLTAGEQFHNTITAPPYMKRRFRGPYVVDQIELPLPLPITALQNGINGPEWLIDPLGCNQTLTGPTHALKVLGRGMENEAHSVTYELLRGPTDYIRACTPESTQVEIGTLPVLGYPIRTWTIGYAPHNSNALQEVPPAYTVRSSAFPACMGPEEETALIPHWEGGTADGELQSCWRTFARDRSLASLDQKLVIPVWVDDAATGNYWLMGEGQKDDERPIIEDIVIYFRHNTRPVNE